MRVYVCYLGEDKFQVWVLTQIEDDYLPLVLLPTYHSQNSQIYNFPILVPWLNIFCFVSQEKGLGGGKMLCDIPLPNISTLISSTSFDHINNLEKLYLQFDDQSPERQCGICKQMTFDFS